MSYTLNQLRDFSTLFSRSEVNRWLKGDFGSIDIKLKRYNLTEQNKGKSYLKFLRNTYRILEKNYPNEYVLKNEFLNNWLKKELGTNNSVIFMARVSLIHYRMCLHGDGIPIYCAGPSRAQ